MKPKDFQKSSVSFRIIVRNYHDLHRNNLLCIMNRNIPLVWYIFFQYTSTVYIFKLERQANFSKWIFFFLVALFASKSDLGFFPPLGQLIKKKLYLLYRPCFGGLGFCCENDICFYANSKSLILPVLDPYSNAHDTNDQDRLVKQPTPAINPLPHVHAQRHTHAMISNSHNGPEHDRKINIKSI